MNMYWKYQKYHWKSWLSAVLFSLFCGPVVILINFIFLSIAYCYDRSRAEKEMKKSQYHSEIIDAVREQLLELFSTGHLTCSDRADCPVTAADRL